MIKNKDNNAHTLCLRVLQVIHDFGATNSGSSLSSNLQCGVMPIIMQSAYAQV
jgi:hypothetical protein